MDLLDVSLEEGYEEQDKNGEEAEIASRAVATAVQFSNEGKPAELQEIVPEVYKYGGSGMNVPTERTVTSITRREYSLERLKKLLPIIPGK